MSRLGLELDDDGAKPSGNNECLLDPPFRELRSVEVEDPEVVRLCPLRELRPLFERLSLSKASFTRVCSQGDFMRPIFGDWDPCGLRG